MMKPTISTPCRAWPPGPGTTFREERSILCRGDDCAVYRVIRREQWVAVAGLDGRRRWHRTEACNYALDDGRPVGALDDGRFVVTRANTLLTPL